MASGSVFDIQRFSIHDGPGIRTTVFLKGCPLSCQWCHNPESQRRDRELFYTPTLCISCGACVDVCPQSGHRVVDGAHTVDRSDCILCMSCAEACPTGAMEAVGRDMSAEEVLAEVERDKIFYEQSGGGMTVSGGEPLAQHEFSLALLAGARARNLHTCVETCGFAPKERALELAGATDLLLWDLKDTNPERHEQLTGVPLQPILDNLRAVDESGAETLIRCILLEGVNLEEAHLEGVADITGSLSHCRGVEVLPYHSLGRSKLERLGRPDAKSSVPDDPWVPEAARVEWAKDHLRNLSVTVVDDQ